MVGLRRALLLMCLGVVLAAACASAQGAETRTVLIDYVHDQVASSFFSYFPRNVVVRPGDTVLFRQQWTGEPHSVTMGSAVDEMMAVVVPLIERYGDTEPPENVLMTYFEAVEALPFSLDEDYSVAQNAGQPCYLDEGLPPVEPETPCSPDQRRQPAFNGRQSYYNSGFIAYEGEGGNSYAIPIAPDATPGTYAYYCTIHGPFHGGTVTIVGDDQPIPTQAEVADQALEEINAAAEPLLAAYDEVEAAEDPVFLGQPVTKPIAGWYAGAAPGSQINEFIPEHLTVAAGEPVTWTFVGPHTVSFDVPSYFAEIDIAEDGTVAFSPDALLPRGYRSLPRPEAEESEPSDGPPRPLGIFAGAWDGDGFLSSGIRSEGTFTMVFERPGRYRYACLIHPQMVARVDVT